MSALLVATLVFAGVSVAANIFTLRATRSRRRQRICLCGHGINEHDDDRKCWKQMTAPESSYARIKCSCVEFCSSA